MVISPPREKPTKLMFSGFTPLFINRLTSLASLIANVLGLVFIGR